MPITQHAGYLYLPLYDPETLVADARRRLAAIDFDTVVGTGLSGTLAVSLVGRELGRYWAIVRKTGDGSHSGNRVEGTIGDRWVFLDDLSETGASLRRTREAVEALCARHLHATTFVGAYYYVANHFAPNVPLTERTRSN